MEFVVSPRTGKRLETEVLRRRAVMREAGAGVNRRDRWIVGLRRVFANSQSPENRLGHRVSCCSTRWEVRAIMAARQSRNAFGHWVVIMAMVLVSVLAVQFGLAGARLQATLRPERKAPASVAAETPVIGRWQAPRGTTGCIDAQEALIIDRYRSNPRAQLQAVLPRRMAKICFGVRRQTVLTQHADHSSDIDTLLLLALDDGRLVYVPRRDVERVSGG